MTSITRTASRVKPHIITAEMAYEIDRQWSNGDGSGLRLVDHRISGGRTVTVLTVPGDDSAPCYRRVSNGFEHVSGPERRMTKAHLLCLFMHLDRASTRLIFGDRGNRRLSDDSTVETVRIQLGEPVLTSLMKGSINSPPVRAATV